MPISHVLMHIPVTEIKVGDRLPSKLFDIHNYIVMSINVDNDEVELVVKYHVNGELSHTDFVVKYAKDRRLDVYVAY